MVFDPRGRWWAVAGNDRSLHVYDLPDGSARASIPIDTHAVRLAVSGDGSRIAAVDFGKRQILIANIDAREVETTIETPIGIRSLAWSPTASILVGGGDDACTYIWDTDTSELLDTLCSHVSPVTEIMFSHDGGFFATSGWDGLTCMWHADERVLVFAPLRNQVIVGLGNRLATARGNAIDFWEIAGGPALKRIKAPGEFGASPRISCSSEGAILLSAGANGVILWDAMLGKPLLQLTESFALEAMLDPQQRSVTALLRDGVHTWDLDRREDEFHIGSHEHVYHRSGLIAGAPMSDRGAFAFASYTTVELFDAQRHIVTDRLPNRPGIGGSISLSRNGQWLFTSNWRGDAATVWDLSTRDVLATFEGASVAGAFSPDDRLLVTSNGRTIEVFDTATWTRLHQLHRDNPEAIAGAVVFANGCNTAAINVDRFDIILFDAETGRITGRLTNPFLQRITDLAFDATDDRLFGVTDRSSIHVWDLNAIDKGLQSLNLGDQTPILR